MAKLQVETEERSGGLVRLCPNPQSATLPQLIKLTVESQETEDGFDLDLTLAFCDLYLPKIDGSITECSDDPATTYEIELLRSVLVAEALPYLDFNAEGYLSRDADGNHFFKQPVDVTISLGTDVDKSEPLPRWDTDRAGCGIEDDEARPEDCVVNLDRIIDLENDGKPGLTVQVTGKTKEDFTVLDGEVYLAYRFSFLLDLEVQNANCISGTFQNADNIEYEVVHNELKIITPMPPGLVAQELPLTYSKPGSTLKVLRADGEGEFDFDDDDDGEVTCAEIIKHEQAFLTLDW